MTVRDVERRLDRLDSGDDVIMIPSLAVLLSGADPSGCEKVAYERDTFESILNRSDRCPYSATSTWRESPVSHKTQDMFRLPVTPCRLGHRTDARRHWFRLLSVHY
jgi:hypothetical protein